MNFEVLKNKVEKMNGWYDSINYNLDRYAKIGEELFRRGWLILKEEDIENQKKKLLKCEFLKNIDKLTDEELGYYARLELARSTACTVSLYVDYHKEDINFI